MTLTIVNYIVQFKDAGVWFDGHVPAAMKECKRVRDHYEDGGFETRIVHALLPGRRALDEQFGPPNPWVDSELQRLLGELEEPHTCHFDGPFVCDHPDCVREAQLQQQSEIDAENAWLRAAEAPTAEDYAFEAWEAQRISPAEYDRAYGPYGGRDE